MWDEAEKITLAGVTVYAYGLFVCLGAACALIALWALSRKKQCAPGTAALTGALAVTLGFIGARALFCLLDGALGTAFPLRAYFLATGGGYSMLGALAGAGLGALLAARLTRQSPLRLLDCLAAALPLFIFFARLGERFVPDFGISRPLVGALLQNTFLCVTGEYDSYLATYYLEAAAAAVLFIVLLLDLRASRRAGNTFLLFLLLFGASQTLLESLRFDQHMRIAFVGLQQVLSMALLGGALIALCRRAGRRRGLFWAAVCSIPLTVALGVGLEFMIDRTNISRYLLYLVYILVLAAPVCLGLRLRREE